MQKTIYVTYVNIQINKRVTFVQKRVIFIKKAIQGDRNPDTTEQRETLQKNSRMLVLSLQKIGLEADYQQLSY